MLVHTAVSEFTLSAVHLFSGGRYYSLKKRSLCTPSLDKPKSLGSTLTPSFTLFYLTHPVRNSFKASFLSASSLAGHFCVGFTQLFFSVLFFPVFNFHFAKKPQKKGVDRSTEHIGPPAFLYRSLPLSACFSLLKKKQ